MAALTANIYHKETETMKSEKIIEILLAQLALEDPTQCVEARDNSRNDNSYVATLMRRIVREACAAVDDDTDEDAVRKEVCQRLSRTADLLGHAASALWQAMVIKRAGVEMSPLLHVFDSKGVTAGYKSYLAALKRFAAVIARIGIDPMRIPAMNEFAQELEALPDVFAFLVERRFQLRKFIHPTALRINKGSTLNDTGADRGDQISVFYHIFVGGACLCEAPENWTLRDKPEELRQTLSALLSDLHHYVDAAEIGWKSILTDAQREYAEECGDR